MFKNLESVLFSELIRHNYDVPMVFSPNGNFTAYAVKNQLVLKNDKSNEIQTRFICDYAIDLILWSPDSELICCGMCKQNLIQVWNINDPSYKCKISEGYFEIRKITWSPDSRHLLVNCEFNLKFTVWSLVSPRFTVIENAKFSKNSFSFSNCCKYMAIIQRKDFEDYIGIFSCDSWQCLKCFPVETENAVGVYFFSSDLTIAVLSDFIEYKVLFYCIDGRLMSTYNKSNDVLGISSFCGSSKSNYILIGDNSKQITVLDRRFKEVCYLNLPVTINSVKMNFYRIVEKVPESEKMAISNFSSKLEIYEIVNERPTSIATVLDSNKAKEKLLKSGIHMIKCSFDGEYFSIISGTLPNVVFILNTNVLSFSDIIEQKLKVKDVMWHPQKSILAICTDSCFVDLWTPTCCIRIVSPYENEFLLKNIEWCPNADRLILNGKDSSFVLNLSQDFS